MLNRKHFLRGAIALAASMTFGAVAHAETTIVLNAFLPAPDPLNAAVVRPWAEDIAKATDGRVKIQIPPTSVAAPEQLWNSVRNSVIDAAYLFNGTVQGQLPLMQMPHLPFLGTSARANSIALWRTYEKYFAAAGEYKDVHLLAVLVLPPSLMYAMKQPITAVKDLQGVKVWALPGVPARVMELAHAGVVSTPAAKMSEIVAGGTVDAFAGIPDMHAETFKVIRYAKSATVLPGGLSSPSFSLVVNKQKWNSIPQSDRDIITRLSGEAFAARMAAFDKVEAAAHEKALHDGLRYLQAPAPFVQELKKIAAPLFDEWLAAAAKRKVDGKAALAFYEAQSAESAK